MFKEERWMIQKAKLANENSFNSRADMRSSWGVSSEHSLLGQSWQGQVETFVAAGMQFGCQFEEKIALFFFLNVMNTQD